MTRRRIAIAIAVASLALASCSSTEAGTATPAPGSEKVAPPVTDPLDAEPFLKDPCALVPAELGYKNPKASLPENSSTARLAGPGCDWRGDVDDATLSVNIQTENAKNGMGGMQGVYDGHFVTGQYRYLEPVEVAGYPAAYADLSDLRDRGESTIRVGISEDVTFSVALGPLGDGKKAEVDKAIHTVAEAVIKTLKAGQ